MSKPNGVNVPSAYGVEWRGRDVREGMHNFRENFGKIFPQPDCRRGDCVMSRCPGPEKCERA
ncbi:MAG: hypothetical protein FWB85_01240 [Chitinispirillia bacterium]|nr:hypothetical protein [Chitinispirillia bacterium]MCL2241283.1 hypothetical protein [Chitinispirillia bacterium]